MSNKHPFFRTLRPQYSIFPVFKMFEFILSTYDWFLLFQFVSYPAGYTGTKVSYELRCDPLRRSGEFCYYRTPDNFCPCSTQCHTNGFYGTCLWNKNLFCKKDNYLCRFCLFNLTVQCTCIIKQRSIDVFTEWWETVALHC